MTVEQANAVIDIATVLTQQYLAWLSWGFDDDWTPEDRNYVGPKWD